MYEWGKKLLTFVDVCVALLRAGFLDNIQAYFNDI
jgi:hypothetical protein